MENGMSGDDYVIRREAWGRRKNWSFAREAGSSGVFPVFPGVLRIRTAKEPSK